MWVVDTKAGEVSVLVSLLVYSREAVTMAARILAPRAGFFEEAASRGSIKVILQPVKPLDADGLRSLAGDFLCELLNQECRLDLAKANGAVQKLLVTQALYAARQECEQAPGRSRITKEQACEMAAEAHRLVGEEKV